MANISLTKSLKACLSNLLGVEIPAHQEKTDKLLKTSRCHYCNWRLDCKTSAASIVCIVLTCNEHRHVVCINCSD